MTSITKLTWAPAAIALFVGLVGCGGTTTETPTSTTAESPSPVPSSAPAASAESPAPSPGGTVGTVAQPAANGATSAAARRVSPADAAYLNSLDPATRAEVLRRQRANQQAIDEVYNMTKGSQDSLKKWSLK